jgi:hypothetical protein
MVVSPARDDIKCEMMSPLTRLGGIFGERIPWVYTHGYTISPLRGLGEILVDRIPWARTFDAKFPHAHG